MPVDGGVKTETAEDQQNAKMIAPVQKQEEQDETSGAKPAAATVLMVDPQCPDRHIYFKDAAQLAKPCCKRAARRVEYQKRDPC